MEHLDTNDKKSRKTSATTHFLNMERSVRKAEDDLPWDQTLTPIIGTRLTNCRYHCTCNCAKCRCVKGEM
ncbi:hypothetical protein HW555_012411 [Spodoptera exigua]|uniref:Uncharacterized protein n=1 Tax=Spodoptera exigua TaxID=7107 RepID=A0A835G5L4_SPOEX|nr:hypothetical protein HW555_012411 [Spodoptera exigua]